MNARGSAASDPRPLAAQVADVLDRLRALGTPEARAGMARFAIHAERAFGTTMPQLRALARQLGRSHALAAGLWESGWHDARLLATLVDVPAQVDAAQMDAWAADFDNWALCDSACFGLFDRCAGAWARVDAWAPRPEEFVRRGAFALLAGLAVHDKRAADAPFLRGLGLVEAHANDPRNFVWKAINWALRAIGKRKLSLHGPALDLARALADAGEPARRKVGKDALRELDSAAVRARLAAKASASAKPCAA